MTYAYENSSPERFQHFCQTLLLPEYPGLQCFPVGQPDGGRDAWQADTHTVLQVKFRRADEEESADWMIATLESELPKIKRLVDAGAKSYVMVTNARGTAHPSSGRIDKVQEWLTDHVPCPATCLWRDDVDRRFDAAPVTLKFKYPEVLTGEDGVLLALSQVLGPQRERQKRCVRAFIATQFAKDSKVKFKQVNLSNSLADLFIDIPLRLSENLEREVRRTVRGGHDPFLAQSIFEELGLYAMQRVSGDIYLPQRRGSGTGAATFLLGPSAQEHLTRVVLEGAPGQGKSTLAQFVCQVHRATLLQERSFLDSVPERFRLTSFRLPLKVDLRDLAAFVSRHEDPESASLEVFLSDLIHTESGNQKFEVDDLMDVMATTPTLLFMDGLDEVADLKQRQALVTVVGRAMGRYEHLGFDTQVVVTSRPSVFGKKASFDAGFVTIDLGRIGTSLVMDYSNRWVKARALDENEAADVLSILRDKMELPHIVELTRNPMQLTILLSLIHQIGYSLPDQRTDLYRRYLELFLIREAEKTPSVKRHSAILVSFIQHLAWVLQSQAESAGTRGSISEMELQEMARGYLLDAKHPVELADDLFGGGLERIFVLVQRVSGMYEFEVQPLREFFCARHLYETSPVGTYRSQAPRGDRAQRFEALAANPFWLNVTRFYAGSYEPGEIGSLVMSLKEMISGEDAALSIHGRRVAVALIADWVFANKKSWQDQLLEAACDSPGIHLLAHEGYAEADVLALDEECGQATLRRLVFDELAALPATPQVYGYCALLNANGGSELATEFLSAMDGAEGVERSRLLTRMVLSGAADTLPLADTLALAQADSPNPVVLGERLSTVLERFSGRIHQDEEVLQLVVRCALDGNFARGSHTYDLLNTFADVLGRMPMNIFPIAAHRQAAFLTADYTSIEAFQPPASLVPEFLRLLVERTAPGSRVGMRSFEQSKTVADLACEVFGGRPWAAAVIALVAAGVPTSTDVRHANALFDEKVSLVDRTRYARLKRNSVAWWIAQLEGAKGDEENRIIWASLVLAWTSPKVFAQLQREAETVVNDMSDDSALRLAESLRAINRNAEPRKDRDSYVPNLEDVSDRFLQLAIVGFRLSHADVESEVGKRDLSALSVWLDNCRELDALAKLPAKDASTAVIVKWLRRIAAAQRFDARIPHRVRDVIRQGRLGPKVATAVVSEPAAFPRDVVILAREDLMRGYKPATLTRVSAKENWSFE